MGGWGYRREREALERSLPARKRIKMVVEYLPIPGRLKIPAKGGFGFNRRKLSS